MSTTCRNCKHSAPYSKDGRILTCSRWHQGYSTHNDEIADNEALVENDEGWGCVMGPDFGCVLFEAKP